MNNRHLLSWRFVKAAAVMFLLSGAGFAAYLYLTVNFSVVVPGELYRSAQPSPQELDYFKARYGIRSVLNLRGAKKNEKWYLDEIAAAKSLGLKHVDFKMSTAKGLTSEQSARLIEVMKNAPKPLLIHCHSGANRTGLASAFYLASVKNADEEQAEEQFSLRYGHFPLWFVNSYAMDDTFERMEPILFGWRS